MRIYWRIFLAHSDTFYVMENPVFLKMLSLNKNGLFALETQKYLSRSALKTPFLQCKKTGQRNTISRMYFLSFDIFFPQPGTSLRLKMEVFVFAVQRSHLRVYFAIALPKLYPSKYVQTQLKLLLGWLMLLFLLHDFSSKAIKVHFFGPIRRS